MKCLKLFALFLLCVPRAAFAYVLNENNTLQPKHWELLTPVAYVSTNVVDINTHAIRYYLASDGYSATNTAAELMPSAPQSDNGSPSATPTSNLKKRVW